MTAGEHLSLLFGQRLLRKNIERGPAEPARAQSLGDGRFVDHAAARRVDQDGAALHVRERDTIEQVAGFPAERHMQRHNVARLQQTIEIERGDLSPGLRPGGIAGRKIGIAAGDIHAERGGAGADLAADGTKPDQPQPLAAGFAAHQLGARPFAGDHGVGGDEGATQQHQHRRDHIFHHGGVIGAGCRINGDAARLTGGDVDIVESNAEPADRFEPRRRGQRRRVDFGAIAHDQRARIGERRQEIGAAVDKPRIVTHVMTGEDTVDGILVHELGDHNRGH